MPRSPFIVVILLAAIVVATSYVTYRLVDPLPPRHLAIAAGAAGSGYDNVARQYARILARNGVDLEIRNFAGAVENLDRLRDPASGVQAALAPFGVTQPADADMFYSLGGIFDSAIFIFYRNAEPVTLFAQFRGKRLSIGQYAKILELPYRNPEGRAVAEVLARVGARVAGEHRHPGIVERFTVLEGELTVKRADQTSILRQGESAIIEPGIWHDWWNASDRDARVRVEVAPGERFAHIIPTPGVCRIYCSSHYALAALHESSAT